MIADAGSRKSALFSTTIRHVVSFGVRFDCAIVTGTKSTPATSIVKQRNRSAFKAPLMRTALDQRRLGSGGHVRGSGAVHVRRLDLSRRATSVCLDMF